MKATAKRLGWRLRATATAVVIGSALFCVQASTIHCRESQATDTGQDKIRETQIVADSARAAVSTPDSIVAVYYHRTLRCQTCLMMEACAESVMMKRFAKELVKGKLHWRDVDFEQSEHSGMEKKYGLDGSSLVLSHWKKEKEVSWARMDELWELSDDPDAVSERVLEQLMLCLAGKCDHEGDGSGKESGNEKTDRAVREL